MVLPYVSLLGVSDDISRSKFQTVLFGNKRQLNRSKLSFVLQSPLLFDDVQVLASNGFLNMAWKRFCEFVQNPLNIMFLAIVQGLVSRQLWLNDQTCGCESRLQTFSSAVTRLCSPSSLQNSPDLTQGHEDPDIGELPFHG